MYKISIILICFLLPQIIFAEGVYITNESNETGATEYTFEDVDIGTPTDDRVVVV